MSVTLLYRISSNEVLKISPKGQTFADRDSAVFGVLTNPTLNDGNQVREELANGDVGPLRVLGFAQISNVGGNSAANATQGEIDGFNASQVDDESQLDADRAADLSDIHPHFRRLVKSMLKGIVRENNIMSESYNELRAEILAASSLGDLQTRVTNNTSDVPTRTNQQAYDAVRTDVDKDD